MKSGSANHKPSQPNVMLTTLASLEGADELMATVKGSLQQKDPFLFFCFKSMKSGYNSSHQTIFVSLLLGKSAKAFQG
jgi:hypothetical protein